MVRYRAKCQDCDFQNIVATQFKRAARMFAEEHMMQTGHIVEIVEVK